MATTNGRTVTNGVGGLKQKRGASASSSPIRIKHKTREKLEQLLKQVNKDRVGRRIKPDDVMWFSLGLLTDEHLAEICNSALSNKDKVELLFRKVSKQRKGTTREEFFGMLLEGKLAL